VQVKGKEDIRERMLHGVGGQMGPRAQDAVLGRRMDRDSSEAISREAERRPRSQRMIEEFIKMVEEFAKWRELKVGLS